MFREPQYDGKVVATVIEGTPAREGVLDPLGAEVAPGAGAYRQILLNLAASLKACLSCLTSSLHFFAALPHHSLPRSEKWAMTLRRWTTASAILACALGAAAPAMAHPHVWVEMRSDVVFNDQGLITALNLMWTFDDNYTQMALDGLDTNGDGVYSPDELEP